MEYSRLVRKRKNIKNENGVFSKLEDLPFIGKILIILADTIFFLLHFFVIHKNMRKGDIVIISFHRLGDTVFTIPAIKEIFSHYKNYKKKILCYPESKKIYEIVFKSEELEILDKSEFIFGQRIATQKAREKLKRLNPEIIFDLTGTVTSVSLIFNSSASTLIGMNSRFFKGIYTSFVKRRKAPHLIDSYLDIVNATIPIERSKAIYEFKKDFNPNGKIIIHPFAIRDAKAWNLTKYISLAEYLNDNYLVEIVSPPDVLADNIKEEIIKKGIAVTITETIDNLIQKLKECSIFISNDTGPLYIANLLGKATFTIYGPTNPEYSLPFGKYHRFIQKELECSPETGHQFCYTLAGIYCPVYECMNKLDFEEVKNSILAFINDIDLQTKNNPIQ